MGDIAQESTKQGNKGLVSSNCYAHSLPGMQEEKWQTLEEHSCNVAKLAAEFAESFGCAETARLLGLVHDIGKARREFQQYLRRASCGKQVTRGEVKHAAYSGIAFMELVQSRLLNVEIADLLANITMSHHGGLHDMIEEGERSVIERTNGMVGVEIKGLKFLQIDAILSKVKDEVCAISSRVKSSFAFHFTIKFLYSCLVDADRCDAANIRDEHHIPYWEKVLQRLESRLSLFPKRGRLDEIRGRISLMCKRAGMSRSKGVYTLSIPTGGGKTLSSFRFAVEHAKEKKLKRIIYVSPFLSIIDQTANEFREILGDDVDNWLLEHHSDFDTSEDLNSIEEYKQLVERWSCPIIVTTMVQFLETIASNRASKLRKFHNMSDAVFIFDEIQALPIKCTYLFNVIVNFLSKQMGSTVVLCTATQPHLNTIDFPIELSKGHQLVELSSSDLNLFHRTKIVDLTQTEKSSADVADFAKQIVLNGECTLVVVNTKKAANDIYFAIKDCVDTFILTTNMCAAHRLDELNEIRHRLEGKRNKRPFVCVSTQLIEAGVDISFDCVIRALAGWTSVIQAAGRCNRHGESSRLKSVYVIKMLEDLSRLPDIAAGKEISTRVLNEFKDENLLALNVMEQYCDYYSYRKQDEMSYLIKKLQTTLVDLLGKNKLGVQFYRDQHGGDCYRGLPFAFKTAADNFSVIGGVRIDVIVPYIPKGQKVSPVNGLIDRLKAAKQISDVKERYLKRAGIIRILQKYIVSVYFNKESDVAALSEKVDDMFYLLSSGAYDKTGFISNSFLYVEGVL